MQETATPARPVAEAAPQVPQLPAVRQRASLVAKFAARYSIDPDKLLPILKATAFKQKKGEVSNEQMAALLIVADQYKLNPFTREIFAFPDKQNGIVPVVSVDGWARIINEDMMLNGLEFRYSETMIEPGKLEGLKVRGHEWIEAVIYRKDRDRPVVIREYLEEVYRPPFTYDDGNKKDSAWQTHTKRFHRHKALIQGARIAFGFAGLFDEDEAHRIVEGQVLATDPLPVEPARGAAGLKNALIQPKDPTPAEAQADAQSDAGERMAERTDTVIDHIAKLDEMDSLEEISAYAEKLPPEIVNDERWAKATAARLRVINEKTKGR